MEFCSTVVTEHIMKEVLAKDRGPEADLISWDVVDLSSAESINFSTIVKRILVTFSINNKTFNTSYIVKSNPINKTSANDYYTAYIFETEVRAYTDVIPLLNELLSRNNESVLKTATCFYAQLEKHEELIILEDLTNLEFKSMNILEGMTEKQVKLTLKELAKLHAASYLLQKSTTNRELTFSFDILRTVFRSNNGRIREDYNKKYCQVFQDIQTYAKNMTLDDVAAWLQKVIDDVEGCFKELYDSQDPFKVICHGDCWGGNFMFKENNKGEAVDVRMIDFQLIREGSLVTDISYLLYNCVNGSLRMTKHEQFILSYHTEFCKLLNKFKFENALSLNHLFQEHKRKLFFGMMLAFLLLPLVAEKEYSPKCSDAANEESDYNILPLAGNNSTQFFNSKFVSERFLSIFKDIQKYFLTDSNSSFLSEYSRKVIHPKF